MLRNLSVVAALLLVVAIAAPAMAYTGTFTNTDSDNAYYNADNWAWSSDATGPDINPPSYPERHGDSYADGNFQTLVFGAYGTTTCDQSYYAGTDIVDFTGPNNFTMTGALQGRTGPG